MAKCSHTLKLDLQRAKAFCQLITIEPLMFFHAAAFELVNAIKPFGLYEKICRQHFSDLANVTCTRNDKATRDTSNAIDPIALFVQTNVTYWSMVITISIILVVFIVSPIYAAYSDKNGRKSVILIAVMGVLLMEYLFLIAFNYVDLWLGWVAIGCAVLSFTGFVGGIHSAAFAYMADRVPDKNALTIRFTIVHVVIYVSEIIFTSSAAEAFRTVSITRTTLIPIVLHVAAFFCALILLKEVPPLVCNGNAGTGPLAKGQLHLSVTQNELHAVNDLPDAEPQVGATVHNGAISTIASSGVGLGTGANLKRPSIVDVLKTTPIAQPSMLVQMLREAVVTACRSRQGHYRAYIWVTIFASFFSACSAIGGNLVFKLYVLNKPLQWSLSELSHFVSFQAAMRLVGCLTTGICLKKFFHLHETTLMLIAIASLFFNQLLLGVGQSNVTVYLSGAVGCQSIMLQVAGKSLITQFVDVDETAKVFTLFLLVVGISVVVATAGIMNIFNVTKSAIFPGFVFLLLAGFLLVSFIAMLWVHVDYMRYRRTLAETAEASKTGSPRKSGERSLACCCAARTESSDERGPQQ